AISARLSLQGFRSASARKQHIRDSADHYICHICPEPFDYETQNELDDHLETEHHICIYCDRPPFRTSKQLDQHDVDKHNMCIHKITHAEKNIECAGCDRLFVTESAMLLHLEAVTCDSIADRYYVTLLGRQCYRTYEYRSVTPGYDFRCPTCESDFHLMSGLVQHV
ncbi:hypothetical protein H9L39_16576, partial [Fusarium oxysporum f. sp. albedinis]